MTAILRCALTPALFCALLFTPAAVPRLHAQASAAVSDSGQQSTPEAQSPEKAKQEEDETEAFRHSPAVTSFGAKLGMNPTQAASAFTLLNFLLLAIGMGYVLLKTLPKTFRKRTSDIQKHLVDARTATEEASVRLSSVEERLSRLDGQIEAMRKQSEADAARDQARILASVEEEKQKILAAAEQEIASATVNAQRQIQRYAAELAIEQAARKLVVTAETDRMLVQNFGRRLGEDAGDPKKGQN